MTTSSSSTKLTRLVRDQFRQSNRFTRSSSPCPACFAQRQTRARTSSSARSFTTSSYHQHTSPIESAPTQEHTDHPRTTSTSRQLDSKSSFTSTRATFNHNDINGRPHIDSSSSTIDTIDRQLAIHDDSPSLDSGLSGSALTQDLLSSVIGPSSSHSTEQPTLQDVDNLKPRRMFVPQATSPPSHRTIYQKQWQASLSRLDHAFTKQQLSTIVNDLLGLNLNDPRLKTHVKRNKRGSFSNSTTLLSKINKKDLCLAIMVLHWNLIDPQVIPPLGLGSQVSDSVQLSDRTLFLLLEPKANVLANLTKRFGVKLSFTREPTTSRLMLNFRGGELAVQSAKTEIEVLTEKSLQQDLQLPRPATELRPEIYQTISRLAKTFLEPGPRPDVITATSTQQRNLDQTQQLLSTAFADHASSLQTSVFVSVPSSFTSLEYSMSPLTPTTKPVFPNNSCSTFSRLKLVSRLSEQQQDEQEQNQTKLDEMLTWSNKMGMKNSFMSRSHMFTPLKSNVESTNQSILKTLILPFQEEELNKTIKQQQQQTQLTNKFELSVQFGHVVWPLFSKPNLNSTTLGPTLDGAWELNSFQHWKQGAGRDVKSVFLPSPPVGFLSSTGVLERSIEPNPFDFLTGLSTHSINLNQKPKFNSKEFRKIIFKPIVTKRNNDFQSLERIEFQIRQDGKFDVIRLKQSMVHLMVPTGSCDLMLNLTCRDKLEELDLPDIDYDSNLPKSININGTIYNQSSDYLTRTTTIIPPLSNEESNSTKELIYEIESNQDKRGQFGKSEILSRSTHHFIKFENQILNINELQNKLERLLSEGETRAMKKWSPL
ncbi:hypothetical protein OIO90_002382 [Microbotryomycetes sp. JL221]|nr:hypothetical protein OIO90_002382 [Microbotryomycetes sp. JL221]